MYIYRDFFYDFTVNYGVANIGFPYMLYGGVHSSTSSNTIYNSSFNTFNNPFKDAYHWLCHVDDLDQVDSSLCGYYETTGEYLDTFYKNVSFWSGQVRGYDVNDECDNSTANLINPFEYVGIEGCSSTANDCLRGLFNSIIEILYDIMPSLSLCVSLCLILCMYNNHISYITC